MDKYDKKFQLISDDIRTELDSHRNFQIDSIEKLLWSARALTQIYLNEGRNPIIRRSAEDEIAVAVSLVCRVVNDYAHPIDKADFLDNVAAVFEERIYSPELEKVNPQFVDEYIYSVLHHDLPAFRAQLAQHHDVPEPVGMR
jgi:hypothetical protein